MRKFTTLPCINLCEFPLPSCSVVWCSHWLFLSVSFVKIAQYIEPLLFALSFVGVLCNQRWSSIWTFVSLNGVDIWFFKETLNAGEIHRQPQGTTHEDFWRNEVVCSVVALVHMLRGVRQRCPISPHLFNHVMDDILNESADLSFWLVPCVMLKTLLSSGAFRKIQHILSCVRVSRLHRTSVKHVCRNDRSLCVVCISILINLKWLTPSSTLVVDNWRIGRIWRWVCKRAI